MNRSTSERASRPGGHRARHRHRHPAGMSSSAIGRNPDAAGQIRGLAIILAGFAEGLGVLAIVSGCWRSSSSNPTRESAHRESPGGRSRGDRDRSCGPPAAEAAACRSLLLGYCRRSQLPVVPGHHLAVRLRPDREDPGPAQGAHRPGLAMPNRRARIVTPAWPSEIGSSPRLAARQTP